MRWHVCLASGDAATPLHFPRRHPRRLRARRATLSDQPKLSASVRLNSGRPVSLPNGRRAQMRLLSYFNSFLTTDDTDTIRIKGNGDGAWAITSCIYLCHLWLKIQGIGSKGFYTKEAKDVENSKRLSGVRHKTGPAFAEVSTRRRRFVEGETQDRGVRACRATAEGTGSQGTSLRQPDPSSRRDSERGNELSLPRHKPNELYRGGARPPGALGTGSRCKTRPEVGFHHRRYMRGEVELTLIPRDQDD